VSYDIEQCGRAGRRLLPFRRRPCFDCRHGPAIDRNCVQKDAEAKSQRVG
jgi:hypothetical protein